MSDMKEIENLPEFEAGSGVDLSEFEGTRTRIQDIEIKTVKTQWEAGKKLPDGQFKDTKVLKISSEPLTKLKNKEGKEIDVRATELFNLTLKDGKWGISKSPKSAIQKFLNRQKVGKAKDLLGTMVTITTNQDKEGRTFLGFVVK